MFICNHILHHVKSTKKTLVVFLPEITSRGEKVYLTDFKVLHLTHRYKAPFGKDLSEKGVTSSIKRFLCMYCK